MHQCSLSITYACPYCNPTTTMGHSIHNVASATASPTRRLYKLSAICPCTVKTGIHPWREHLSKVPDAIECEYLPTQVGYDSKLAVRLRPRWGRRTCRWASLRRFLTVCAEMLWLCNRLLQQLSGASLRTILEVRYWMWRSWVGVVTRGLLGCEAGWMHWQILWKAFRDSLW